MEKKFKCRSCKKDNTYNAQNRFLGRDGLTNILSEGIGIGRVSMDIGMNKINPKRIAVSCEHCGTTNMIVLYGN